MGLEAATVSLLNAPGVSNRGPDFFFASWSGFGLTTGLYISSSGQVFVSPPGLGVSAPKTPSLSAGLGYLGSACEDESKQQDKTDSFLTGLGYSTTGGYGVITGAAYSPGNGSAFLIGIGTPGLGGSGSVGLPVGGH